MGLGDRLYGLFGDSVRLADLEPYRRAGSDAYGLIESVRTPGWARLAAWMAYVVQVYGDAVVTTCAGGRYLHPDDATFAQRCWGLAGVWVEEAHKAQATDAYHFVFRLPNTLPHWRTPLRTAGQLAAMRSTLDTARVRVNSDLAAQTDVPDKVRVKRALLDAQWSRADDLWEAKPSYALRGAIGDCLAEALDQAYELGQLLAQPQLLRQVI